MHRLLGFALLALVANATPGRAEVALAANGFASENSVAIAASPEEVWAALIEPSRWWNGEHSYSGDPANFRLEPRAGGCFCETFGEGGEIEHMRVVLYWPARTLRLVGGLGPLQSEGLAGTLTWQIEPADDGGTRLTQTYVVGGNMRMDSAQTAPLVDMVVREQLERLAALFEPAS